MVFSCIFTGLLCFLSVLVYARSTGKTISVRGAKAKTLAVCDAANIFAGQVMVRVVSPTVKVDEGDAVAVCVVIDRSRTGFFPASTFPQALPISLEFLTAGVIILLLCVYIASMTMACLALQMLLTFLLTTLMS